MKDWRLVFGALWRKRARTLFTLFSTVAVFVLFGLAMALRHGFTSKADFPGADLMFVSASSHSSQMPLAYGKKLARMPGTEAVLPMTFAPVYYQDEKNSVDNSAVVPVAYEKVFGNTFTYKSGSFAAWRTDRTGALVSDKAARKYNWKLGQRITLTPTPGTSNPKTSLAVRIDAITKSIKGTPNFSNSVTLHFDYVKTWLHKDTVPLFFVQARNPKTIIALANRVENLFRNSSTPVQAQPLQAMFQNLLSRFGDIGTITLSVVGAALFSLLLVIGNSVTQSIAERRSEFAVLQALGYRLPRLATLIFAEAGVIMFGAGLLGLALGWFIINSVAGSILSILPGFRLTSGIWFMGIGLIVILTAIAAGPGCFMLSRLAIPRALRRV